MHAHAHVHVQVEQLGSTDTIHVHVHTSMYDTYDTVEIRLLPQSSRVPQSY